MENQKKLEQVLRIMKKIENLESAPKNHPMRDVFLKRAARAKNKITKF